MRLPRYKVYRRDVVYLLIIALLAGWIDLYWRKTHQFRRFEFCIECQTNPINYSLYCTKCQELKDVEAKEAKAL